MWWLGHFVGLGVAMVEAPSSDVTDLGPVLELGMGYGVSKDIGIGVQLRGSHLEAARLSTGGACPTETYADLYTFDAGLAGQLVGDWGMAQLWVGGHFATGTSITRYVLGDPNAPPDVKQDLEAAPLLAGGLLVAVDVWKARPHRASVYMGFQLSSEDGPGRFPRPFTGSYRGVTLGIAYRHF